MSNVTVDTPSLKIVDFHNHFVGPSFTLTTLADVPPALQRFWRA